MNLLQKLFAFKNSDGTVNQPTIFGWIAGLVGVLSATEGGPALLATLLDSFGVYKPLVVALIAFLGGASASTTPK